jgi:hypothetical protein
MPLQAYMTRETMAKTLDMKPGFFDQCVSRGIIPAATLLIDGSPRWRWETVDMILQGLQRSTETPVADPYLTGSRSAAEAPPARRGRPQQDRAALSVPQQVPGNSQG